MCLAEAVLEFQSYYRGLVNDTEVNKSNIATLIKFRGNFSQSSHALNTKLNTVTCYILFERVCQINPC